MSDGESAEPLSRTCGRKANQQRASSTGHIRAAFYAASAMLDPEVLRCFNFSQDNSLTETQRQSVHAADFSRRDLTQATEVSRRFRQNIALRIEGMFLQIPSGGRIERDYPLRPAGNGLGDVRCNGEKTRNHDARGKHQGCSSPLVEFPDYCRLQSFVVHPLFPPEYASVD